MSTFNQKLIAHLSELLALLQAQVRKDGARSCPRTRPKFEPPRKGETEMERMLRCARNDIAAGKAVGMHDIARSIPRLRPPRAPGQQQRRWNGVDLLTFTLRSDIPHSILNVEC